MARIIIPQQQRTGGQTTVAVAPRQQAPAQQVVPHNFIGPLLPNQVRAQAPPAQPAQQFSVLPQQPRQQQVQQTQKHALNDAQITSAIAKIKAGSGTKEALYKTYIITDEQKQRIESEVAA